MKNSMEMVPGALTDTIKLQALELATDGFLITDSAYLDNPICYVSKGFEHFSGYAADELLGRNCRLMQGPGTNPDTVAQIRRCIYTKEPFIGELLNYRKSGERFWSLLRIEPIFDSEGKVRFFVGVQSDTTHRKYRDMVNRAYQRILCALAKHNNRRVLLDILSNEIEQCLPGIICSILLYDAKNNTLTHGAKGSLPIYYRDATNGLEIGPQVGTCGRSAALKQRVITENIYTDPNWAAYVRLARQADLGSCWSEPFFTSGGELIGTIASYHRNPYRPTELDLEFTASIAHLAGIAWERQFVAKQEQGADSNCLAKMVS